MPGKFGFEKKYRDSIVYKIHGYIEYEWLDVSKFIKEGYFLLH